MKVNQDSQIYWAISPIYYAARVFGLAPYSIVVKESKIYWKVTKLSTLYNLFVITLVLMGIVPVLLYQKRHFESQNIDNIAVYSDLFRRGSGIVMCLMSLVLSLANRHKTCKLMKDLKDFDRDLHCIGITIDHKATYKNNTICTIVIYFILAAIIVIDFVTFVVVVDRSFFFWAFCILYFLVNYSMVVQFVSFVSIFCIRFENLNSYMERLSRQSFEKKFIKSNIWTTKQSGSQTKHSKQNYINTVCAMHYKLCDWGKNLNAMFSIQILLTAGVTFVVMLIRFYHFYLILTRNLHFEVTFQQVWNPTAWGIMFVQMIFILSYICSKAKGEVDKSAILLHQINFEEDDETRRTIEMFYLQILHQKFAFSACGFFPVDFSLMYMIVGAITTYLVILIQFQMAGSKGKQWADGI